MHFPVANTLPQKKTKKKKRRRKKANSRRFKTVQKCKKIIWNIKLLNEFLDGLGKTIRNSRRFGPNRPEAVLDSLGQEKF